MLVSSALSAQTRLQAFTVSGIVLDTKGKPLKGALVRLRADFVYGRAEVTTGADGRYAISDLIKATYRAEAYVERNYAGATVCQRLAMPKPTDYNSFPVSQGAERNFRWQLIGKVGNTDSYFGATILIFNSDLSQDTSRAVEFTLTPTGSLLDGSKASVIVKEAPLEYPSSDDGLYDLPLGTYRLKAVLIGKDGSRTPLNAATVDSKTYQPEIEIKWRSENRCGLGTDSGVKPFFVQLEQPK
jgi:Carboxypeptidase regulatory-like domain